MAIAGFACGKLPYPRDETSAVDIYFSVFFVFN
jgi:hypothetical protein